MTVRQILNHTSGLPDFTENDAFWAKVAADPRHRFAPAELLALAGREGPYFAPGGGFHYSNTDYIVAGLLLEQVTGGPVGDLLAARVLRPLGLSHTYLDGAEAAVPGLVRGYATDGG
jgi:D-alanyl-D-alanine carboxypeptidase